MAELSLHVDGEAPLEWKLSVDGTSNMKGSNMWIILEGPRDLLIVQELKFEFKPSNN